MERPSHRAIAFMYPDGFVEVFRIEDRDEAEPGFLTFMEFEVPMTKVELNGAPIYDEMPWPDIVDFGREKIRNKIAILPNGTWGDRGYCRGCGDPVVFVLINSGKRPPFNYDGESHFATCTDAARWRTTQPKHPTRGRG